MAPHSSTLAWKIPWTQELGGLESMGSLESDTTERLHFYFSLVCIGERNGNPLQYSCLENPRDRGAWWAAVLGWHRVGHDWSDLAAAAASPTTGLETCVYGSWNLFVIFREFLSSWKWKLLIYLRLSIELLKGKKSLLFSPLNFPHSPLPS